MNDKPKFKLKYWYRGAPESRPGGPYWYRYFKDEDTMNSFINSHIEFWNDHQITEINDERVQAD